MAINGRKAFCLQSVGTIRTLMFWDSHGAILIDYIDYTGKLNTTTGEY